MPEPVMTLCGLVAMALSIVSSACQRANEYRAASDATEAISGFVGFYCDYEICLDGSTFPALTNAPLPLPDYVYRLVPSEFLHNVVAAEVILPDDTVRELVPLSRLTSLRALSVTWSRYSDVELKHLEPFRGLEYLDLSHSSNLTDKGLPQLAVLKNLKVLDISADGISESGIEMLRRTMPNCTINGRMASRYASDPKTTEQRHALVSAPAGGCRWNVFSARTTGHSTEAK